MTKSSIRSAIVLLTLTTAAVHLILLNIGIYNDKGSIDVLFTLNGLGYLGLLGALLYNIPAGRERLVHYAFMAFTLTTIAAWLVLNGDFGDPLSLFTKAVEVLLVVFLWMHLQRT